MWRIRCLLKSLTPSSPTSSQRAASRMALNCLRSRHNYMSDTSARTSRTLSLRLRRKKRRDCERVWEATFRRLCMAALALAFRWLEVLRGEHKTRMAKKKRKKMKSLPWQWDRVSSPKHRLLLPPTARTSRMHRPAYQRRSHILRQLAREADRSSQHESPSYHVSSHYRNKYTKSIPTAKIKTIRLRQQSVLARALSSANLREH